MKDFHAWLSDLTNDLRAEVEPPKPEPEVLVKIDPNSIHAPLISAIKSIAWRAETNQPMEARIEQKVTEVMKLYQQIHQMLEQEVNQGIRQQTELTKLENSVGSWVTEVNMAILRHKPGEIPKWRRNDRYEPLIINH